MGESTFADLRMISDWFASLSPSAAARIALHVERAIDRLGSRAVPLLGRELCAALGRRRDAARAALDHLAAGAARARVIAELRRVAASDASDEGKVCALGLLAELGERSAARFSDPAAIQRRSAIALAAQLVTPADIAAAADMMIRQLREDDLVHLLDVMADVDPAAAHRLGSELCVRLDLDGALRERIADAALAGEPPGELARRPGHPTRVAVLVDPGDRVVVVASRKLTGERACRRWAVLIGPDRRIDDCVHEDRVASGGDCAELIASLTGDGYRVASSELAHARAVVAAAARQSSDAPDRLGPAYYLGRDLLELGDAHLGGRAHAHPTSITLGRATELVADGDVPRARALLARCDAANPDVAAAAAACALAQARPGDALAPLHRALEAEPDWPLHHWNLAAAHHQLGDARACYHALRRFVATSARPTGLYADPDQPSRVALAERLIGELERTARLAGTSLGPPPRRRRTARRSARR
ncbi:MAG TPA: hypothetical protein VLX92_07740 [Kofleriaceae bacterium]|nr:hypothetical protein [Kofleriaceae bacterium]